MFTYTVTICKAITLTKVFQFERLSPNCRCTTVVILSLHLRQDYITTTKKHPSRIKTPPQAFTLPAPAPKPDTSTFPALPAASVVSSATSSGSVTPTGTSSAELRFDFDLLRPSVSKKTSTHERPHGNVKPKQSGKGKLTFSAYATVGAGVGVGVGVQAGAEVGAAEPMLMTKRGEKLKMFGFGSERISTVYHTPKAQSAAAGV